MSAETISTTAHTPGPWQNFGPFALPASNGGREFWTVSAENGNRLIAEIYTEANAALIAAVPELLAAAKRARDVIDYWGQMTTDDLQQTFEQLEAAIAKTESRQS